VSLRPLRALALLTPLAGVALLVAGPVQARTVPPPAPFRVLVLEHVSDSTFRSLARHGAVGLLRPGFGPTTNRRQALAELVRGAEVNARLGGVPAGRPLISVTKVTGTPTGHPVIVVNLPPSGKPIANDRLYRVAVLGRGFHGLLASPTTRIPGLVSIVDIAPTALGRARGSLSSVSSRTPVADLASLGQQINANNRLKYAALFIVVGVALLLALLGLRAATTAVPAALVVNLALGVMQVSNEVALCAFVTVGTLVGALWLARACRGDGSLLLLYGGVVLLYALVLTARPEWAAITPLGPTQNQRFWGIGNQLETLLLAPLLAGAVLARRRFGIAGFAAFAFLGIVVMTDNRLGADGGGAIALGVALAFLGARLLRLGVRGFVTLLAVSATAVLGVVSYNLRQPGPNHLRSAFAHGISGLAASLQSRVPLAYEPALRQWALVLPLAIVFLVTLALALHGARQRVRRDLILSVAVALVVSLLVNDSAGYELAGGIAVLAGAARFSPSYARMPVAVLAGAALEAEPAATKVTQN
jgi:hypothetical protein